MIRNPVSGYSRPSIIMADRLILTGLESEASSYNEQKVTQFALAAVRPRMTLSKSRNDFQHVVCTEMRARLRSGESIKRFSR